MCPRRRRRTRQVSLAFLAMVCIASVLFAGPVLASGLRDVPLPDDARLEIIGIDMSQNGQRVSIASFMSTRTVDEVLSWYREMWPPRDEGPGHVEADVGSWRMISRLQDGTNIALQLQAAANGGANGLLSVLDLEAPGLGLDAPPMPDGATLLSDTVTRDGARQARTVLLEGIGRPASVAAFYRDRLRREGWQVTVDDGDASPAVMLFAGPEGRAELTAHDAPDGRTFVILNVVTGAI